MHVARYPVQWCRSLCDWSLRPSMSPRGRLEADQRGGEALCVYRVRRCVCSGAFMLAEDPALTRLCLCDGQMWSKFQEQKEAQTAKPTMEAL